MNLGEKKRENVDRVQVTRDTEPVVGSFQHGNKYSNSIKSQDGRLFAR
jgi:hypothetical protein